MQNCIDCVKTFGGGLWQPTGETMRRSAVWAAAGAAFAAAWIVALAVL